VITCWDDKRAAEDSAIFPLFRTKELKMRHRYIHTPLLIYSIKEHHVPNISIQIDGPFNEKYCVLMLKITRMLSRVAIAQLPRGRFAIAVTLMSTLPNFTSSLGQCSTRGCNSRERSYVCVPVKCSVCKYTQYTPVQRRLCTHLWNDIWVHALLWNAVIFSPGKCRLCTVVWTTGPFLWSVIGFPA
jgi:hypothetical protein